MRAIIMAVYALAPMQAPAQDEPQPASHAAPGVTSLTNSSVRFRVADNHYMAMERGDVRAILVDNAELDLPELPGHRAGYNGIASLTHRRRETNLFVPAVAGLNFEHIHDGTTAGLVEKFEPRTSPMQLRVVDRHTVEIYQPPTANWKLESCGRYHLLEDGTVEYTFECIPRAGVYRNGTIGLFWASYIHQPESGAIFFRGRGRQEAGPARWIEAISPAHGTDSTHGPALSPSLPPVDADFPLTLVNHPSKYVYTEPWYYGVSNGMAYVQMFRQRDGIWLAQSPSGGGQGNPAWDFQWFVPDCRVGEAYGFVMRAAYLPYHSGEQVERDTRKHREALNP
ncbi:MAG: hypothetical protein HUU20_19125 [Pirellulales bacterium]|nr:hypothetical protein [Pirellulales bacterium]